MLMLRVSNDWGKKGYLKGVSRWDKRVLGYTSQGICMQDQGRCFEAFVLDNAASASRDVVAALVRYADVYSVFSAAPKRASFSCCALMKASLNRLASGDRDQ